MNVKRLLIISDYFYPHWTGISKSLSYFLPFLTKNAQVTILTVKHNSKSSTNERYLNASIVRASYAFTVSRSFYSFSQIGKAWSLIQKADTVCINSPSANMLPLALLTVFFRKDLIVFHQGDIVLPKGMKNKLIEIIFNISFFLTCILAKKVATYNMDYAANSRILPFFQSKTSSVIPPIPLEQEKRVCDNDMLLKLKKEKGRKIYIGFAGRFVEEKGFDLLLKSIPKIAKKFPEIQFLFAGELHIMYEHFFEKEKDTIKNVSRYFQTVGLLDDVCMQYFYDLIDLLVVPSRSDCFNLVQAEAMIRKVPVVVADIPGARFLVKRTNFGYVFRSENVQDLEDKILLGIKNKNVLQKNYKNVLRVFAKEDLEKSLKEFFLMN